MKQRPEFAPDAKLTAYEVLDHVAEIIAEEPARYNQGCWLTTRMDEVRRVGHNVPACGTIGCVAGWVFAEVAGAHGVACVFRQVNDSNDRGVEISEYAQVVLGLFPVQASELFTSMALEVIVAEDQGLDPREIDLDDIKLPAYGTKEYAVLGARHIRRFMAKYENQLKAKVVDVAELRRLGPSNVVDPEEV